MMVIEKTLSDVGGGAVQQTIKRKNYKLQNEDDTHNSNWGVTYYD
jgi:hypothetical protein